MTELVEQLPHNEGFIISEAPGALSREEVTVVQGAEKVLAGTVMGVRGDGKYEALDTASSLGNDTAVGILCSTVDPTAGDVAGVVIERLAEVSDADLIWPDGITTANQAAATAALLVRNIKIRTVAASVTTQAT